MKLFRRFLRAALAAIAVALLNGNFAIYADSDSDFVERHISVEDYKRLNPDPRNARPAPKEVPPPLSNLSDSSNHSSNWSSSWSGNWSPNPAHLPQNYSYPPMLPDEPSQKKLAPPMQIPSVTFPYDIRQPVGVNLFYPADARLLRRQLSALDQPTALEPVPGIAKVFIAPWGTTDGALPVAAKVYQYLKRQGDVKTILLVARSHGEPLAGPASVWSQGGYATPLGIAKINALAAKYLARHPDVNYERAAHETDAAIETNVILAQYFLPEAQIVPVLINPRTRGDFESLCQQFAKMVSGDGVVMIAITNLSYGFPERAAAGHYDLQTISELQTLDLNVINNLGKKRDSQLYQGAGILDSPKVAMAAVLTGLLLELDTLTWFGYDAPRQFPGAPLITGCAAGAFSARARRQFHSTSAEGVPIVRVDAGRLSADAEKELLAIARDSLQSAAALARYDAPYPRGAELLKQRAVFVTVVDPKTDREISSMGTLNPSLRLAVGVTEAARMCALGEDPQMPKRLNSYDARHGNLEVAVLGDLRPASSWTDIKNGQGVAVARGDLRSVVLPGTALRHKWSVEDMLAFACTRAGMRPDAYRSDRVDIFTFTADVYRQAGEPEKDAAGNKN